MVDSWYLKIWQAGENESKTVRRMQPLYPVLRGIVTAVASGQPKLMSWTLEIPAAWGVDVSWTLV